ncbi:MAG: methylated-DNA--[protein]-cysteine S-methyltransferase [Chloroflexota bacterium]
MLCEEVALHLLRAERDDPAVAAEVAEHMSTCTSCREQAAYLRGVARELGALPREAAPAGLAASVLTRVGRAPAKVRAAETVRYTIFPSPVGPLYVAYGGKGIVRSAIAVSESDFAALLAAGGRLLQPEPVAPAAVMAAVAGFTRGERLHADAFDLAVLPAFERSVLLSALTIPRGEVRPYAWIAREIGKPDASRAVGQALGRNPIPLLIPCHRAVRSDGGLGGYAFGLAKKRALLAAEGVDLPALEREARVGVRFHGSRTTGIFCLPTCRHARRIAEPNRVEFHTEAEALAAGYRPCLVCRPSLAVAS